MNPVRKILRFGALLLATASALLANSTARSPDGLSQSDRAGLRAAYDAGRHRIAATAGGHQARNPGQHWRTRFDGQGFLVQPDGAD